MKNVFVCPPAIGNHDQNMAVAYSMSNQALKQGHFTIMGSPQLPGNEKNDEIEDIQLRQCDEVWLYYDGQKLRQDMLTDIQRAAGTDKPVRLVQHETTVDSWPLTAESWPFAADSYAEAPDRDNAPDIESVQDEANEAGEPQININSLLLALKELGDISAEALLPDDWWMAALHGRDDYLLRHGVRGLLELLDCSVEQGKLPPPPKSWMKEVKRGFFAWDWLSELPALDRNNLEKVTDREYHRLGYLLMQMGDCWRATQFLIQVITDDPHHFLAWTDLGHCCLELGEPGLAVETFKIAAKLAPDYGYALMGLGRALKAAGRYAEAIEAFDRVLDCLEDRLDPYVADLRAEAVESLKQSSN